MTLTGVNSSLRCAGLSLMELVIATFVTTVILLGAVSAYTSLSQQDTNSYLAVIGSMGAQVALTGILNDAYGALGSGADLGIRIGPAAAGDNSTICIRKSKVPESWNCYTAASGSLTTEGSLISCTRTALGKCTGSDANYKVFVQSVFMCSTLPVFTVSAGPLGSQRMLFTMNVSVPDPSLTSGRRVVNGSVSPPGHSI